MRGLTRSAALVAGALFISVAAAEAGWQDAATPFDVKRLSQLDESRSKGLSELSSGQVSGDAAAMREIASAPAQNISASELTGSWRCRTMKLGGVVSVSYAWFNCRISGHGGRLYFEKTSGSQRISGYLYPGDGGGFVLLGAWTVKGEPKRVYSGSNPGYGAESTPDDAIGLLSGLGGSHAKIEFPYPVQESTFDVMELKR
ncbi:MAG: DUF4893 domain-containing protein [Proteobacteria bacterium]|nr:DUF4893 domain-containing protein [Pseudomonadota bacterium]